MDAAPAPTKKTTHVATAAEANCLRRNDDACTLATATNEIVGVGGPPLTLPKVALEAHEMVVALVAALRERAVDFVIAPYEADAQVWQRGGGFQGGSEKRPSRRLKIYPRHHH